MISIVIPTYEMHGHGVKMLSELIMSIGEQKWVEHEVIVSDDSNDDLIKNYCEAWLINYYRNPGPKGAAYNLNNAISHAKGGIIKPMFQDDQFLDVDCLQNIAAMKGQWCVCTSAHIGSDRGDHMPYPSPEPAILATGVNTFGSPSAVAWKRSCTDNDDFLPFDTNLVWLFDCDFYARMVQRYGQPEFIPSKVLIREWEGSVTNTIGAGMVRVQELEYIQKKYGKE